MNCNDFLPFGSYLRPIEKMGKGGQTHSGSVSDKIYSATLDINKSLKQAYRDWSEEAVQEISQHFNLDGNDLSELENTLEREYKKVTYPSIVRADVIEQIRVKDGEIDQPMEKGGKVGKASGSTVIGGLKLHSAISRHVKEIDDYFDKHGQKLPDYLEGLANEAQQAMKALQRAVKKEVRKIEPKVSFQVPKDPAKTFEIPKDS